MTSGDKGRFNRVIYAKAGRYAALAFVVSAVIAGIVKQRVFFVFGLCAFAGVYLAWGWFTYLAMTGLRIPGFSSREKGTKKAPAIFSREEKKNRLSKPSFAANNLDFDDDISDRTSTSAAGFTEKEIQKANMIARLATGAIILIVSFFIKY